MVCWADSARCLLVFLCFFARARRGGKKNLQNTAVKELLMKSGNADVLVAPEFTFVKRRGLFSSKYKSVEVSGYPAKYKNFRNK